MNVTPPGELVTELQPEIREKIDAILVENLGKPGATMLVLTLVQETVGYISPPMQSYLAEQLDVPLSHLYGVLTFYSSFRTSPIGRHKVSVCLGTACYVRNGPTLLEKLKQVLGVEVNETTADNRFTLEICRCVGACSQAPVVMIDDDIAGRVDPSKIGRILRKYK
ncbi:MAG TPA: NAD(P)H-dependent oxidoreductase subunit E [Thermoflexia bacterium]|nr:NAD(P)H-dependent oxidoreductase subunit E [Thermoflexia bacterium]